MHPDRKKELEHYLWGLEIIDFLLDAPSVRFTPDEFVSKLRKLQPRLYSIASSLKAFPDQVHFVVASVRYESHGRRREGVASTYLADRSNGTHRFPCLFTSLRAFVCRKITDKPDHYGRARNRGCSLPSLPARAKSDRRIGQELAVFWRATVTMRLFLPGRICVPPEGRGSHEVCTRRFHVIRPTRSTFNIVCWRTPKRFMPGCRREPISTCAETKPEWQRMLISRFIRSLKKRADCLLKPPPPMSKG